MKWYENNPGRFEMEKCLLARHHPGSKVVIKNGRISVLKRVQTAQATYLLEGIFPKNYPYAPMGIYILEPVLQKTPPHQYKGGRLCLHGGNDVGPETTAKVYFDWAVQWLNIYEEWLRGKSWPKRNISRM